jgi:two-component system alkaline phosphatase synthesis response regulator PhoP
MTGKKTVLLVEDDPSLSSTLIDNFEEAGCRTLLAKDGPEGLARALQEHPDMILLDIMLPRLDGLEVLKELRADEWGKQARVILLTNRDDSATIADAVSRGGYDYMVKGDWKIKELVDEVKRRLED